MDFCKYVMMSCMLVSLPACAQVEQDEGNYQQFPYDLLFPESATIEERQALVNHHAWRQFIALNWPANPNQAGTPDTSKSMGDEGLRVWETFKPTQDIFLANGATPADFDTPNQVPAVCTNVVGAKTDRMRALTQITKGPLLNATGQAFAGSHGFLVDQHKQLANYEILTNEPSYDYIVDNQFYQRAVVNAASDFNFPSGSLSKKDIGTLTIKSAWRVLDGTQDPSKFYSETAYVYDETDCSIAQVGLIGLHIAHKTEQFPQWLWATFEHVDNAPECTFSGGVFQTCEPQYEPHINYSFSKNGCSLAECPINKKPSSAEDRTPVQVMRIVALPEPVKQLNANVHSSEPVRGTIWENYMLVGGQWPSVTSSPEAGQPKPAVLANSVMETYFQGEAPLSQTSSCLGCHYLATGNPDSGSVKSDFTYMLRDAK